MRAGDGWGVGVGRERVAPLDSHSALDFCPNLCVKKKKEFDFRSNASRMMKRQ